MPVAVQPKFQRQVSSVLSGNVVLKVYPETAGRSAAALNVAAPSSIVQKVTVQLEDSNGNLLNLLTGFDIDASVAVNFQGDADPSSPTLSDATPAVVNGIATFNVTYDTNTNIAQKVYTEGDTITVTVSTKSGTVLEDAYVAADATYIDTIIA